MKKFFYIMSFVFMSQLAVGETLSSQKKLNVDINFVYTNQSGGQSSIHNTLEMNPDNQWIIIGGLQSQPATEPLPPPTLPSYNQFLLLAKVEKADVKQTTLKFLVIDQDTKSHFIIEPIVTVKYNQKGEIQIHKDHRNIQIMVLAKKETSF